MINKTNASPFNQVRFNIKAPIGGKPKNSSGVSANIDSGNVDSQSDQVQISAKAQSANEILSFRQSASAVNNQSLTAPTVHSVHTATVGVSEANNGQATSVERYTQMLLEKMTSGTGNGNASLTGTPIQVLNAKLFNISIAFGQMSNQGGANRVELELAFRNLTLALFDDAAVALHDSSEDTADLTQIRSDVRNLGQTFLGRFFSEFRNITSESLRNTGMARTELAFHEAWNFTYFEVGMASVGGSNLTPGEPEQLGLDGNPSQLQSDEEFRRLTREMLLNNMRDDIESARAFAESLAEENRRWQQKLEIFSRMMRGDNVAPSDKDFLATMSPGLFMMAMSAMQENENPKDHEPLVADGNNDRKSFSIHVQRAISAYSTSMQVE